MAFTKVELGALTKMAKLMISMNTLGPRHSSMVCRKAGKIDSWTDMTAMMRGGGVEEVEGGRRGRKQDLEWDEARRQVDAPVDEVVRVVSVRRGGCVLGQGGDLLVILGRSEVRDLLGAWRWTISNNRHTKPHGHNSLTHSHAAPEYTYTHRV